MKLSVIFAVFFLAASLFPSALTQKLPPHISSISSLAQPHPSPIPSFTSTPHPSPPSPTPSPTDLTPTTLLAPSSTWAIRYTPTSYLIDFNTTSSSSISQTQVFSIASTSAKFASHLGLKAYDKQSERLARYTAHLERRLSSNHSHDWGKTDKAHKGDKADKPHHKKHGKHYNELSSFYLRHAQCRACTQPNYDLLVSQSLVDLPSYQPYQIMKFCPSTTPQLPHETAPSASSPLPLQDWEGVCWPATQPCPSTTVDLNILSPTTCLNDPPITKQSCALCVLDGYEWRTHRRAVKGGDNYDGQCADPSTPQSLSAWAVAVRRLDECPSALMAAKGAERFMAVSGAFFLFFSFTAALCCCLALRRCCQARKARRAAQVSAVVQGVQEVPVVSSSPSAPASGGYPGEVAAQRVVVSMNEPLLSGLNPPFVSNPPPYAYPRV